MSEGVAHPKLFREMSEPFESQEAAKEALKAFFDELTKLREKHRIKNVVAITETSTLNAEGIEGSGFSFMTIGDRTEAASLCAYAYGALRSEMEEAYGRLLRGKR